MQNLNEIYHDNPYSTLEILRHLCDELLDGNYDGAQSRSSKEQQNPSFSWIPFCVEDQVQEEGLNNPSGGNGNVQPFGILDFFSMH